MRNTAFILAAIIIITSLMSCGFFGRENAADSFTNISTSAAPAESRSESESPTHRSPRFDYSTPGTVIFDPGTIDSSVSFRALGLSLCENARKGISVSKIVCGDVEFGVTSGPLNDEFCLTYVSAFGQTVDLHCVVFPSFSEQGIEFILRDDLLILSDSDIDLWRHWIVTPNGTFTIDDIANDEVEYAWSIKFEERADGTIGYIKRPPEFVKRPNEMYGCSPVVDFVASRDQVVREEGSVTFEGAAPVYHPECTFTAEEAFDLESEFADWRSRTAEECEKVFASPLDDIQLSFYRELYELDTLDKLIEYNRKNLKPQSIEHIPAADGVLPMYGIDRVNYGDSKYAYDTLTDNQRTVYDAIGEVASKLNANYNEKLGVDLPVGVSGEDVECARYLWHENNPDLRDIEFGLIMYRYDENDFCVSVEFDAPQDEENIRYQMYFRKVQLEHSAEAVLATLRHDGTDRSKVTAIANWILDNVDPPIGEELASYGAFAAFFEARASSYGYARVFDLLCHYAGINTLVENGEQDGKDGARNRVFIDGEWCDFDLFQMDRDGQSA